ncbi:MAG: glycosyltransferase [Gemmatimonadaceae bacterium]|nr:glycosyltransferase [Gemmatimonadaceae bacterium]
MLYLAIPAYNEVETIGVLLWRLRTVLAEFPREYEVVVYDDASTDETAEVAAQYERAMPVSVIRGRTHLGYAGAVEALLRDVAGRTRYPRRDAVLLLQGDFTDPPGMVPEFARRFEGGADLVVGERLVVADAPTAVKRLFKGAQWAMRPFVRVDGVRDLTASMRLMRISVLRDALRSVPGALLSGDSWTANADLLLHLVPHARRVEAVPLEPTYGVRMRETRRVAFRDALASLKWAWAARGRRAVAGSAPDQSGDQDRRQRQQSRRRDESEPLSVERLREKVRERDGTHGLDGTSNDGRRDKRRGRERAAATDTREFVDPAAGPRNERAERSERSDRGERQDRPERTPRTEKSERPERPNRPERNTRGDKPDRTEREQTREPARDQGPGRKNRDGRERPARTERIDERAETPEITRDSGRESIHESAIDFDDPFAPRTPRVDPFQRALNTGTTPTYEPPADDSAPTERRPARQPARLDDSLYDDVAAGRPRDRGTTDSTPTEAPVWRPPTEDAIGGTTSAPPSSGGRRRDSQKDVRSYDPAAVPQERARPLQRTDAHDVEEGAAEGPLADVDLDDEAASRVTGEFAYGMASAAPPETEEESEDDADGASVDDGESEEDVASETGAPRKRRRNRRSRRGRRRRGEKTTGEEPDSGGTADSDGDEPESSNADSGAAARDSWRPGPGDHVDGEPVRRADSDADDSDDDLDDDAPDGDDRHGESMSDGAPRPRRRGRRGRRGGARRSRNRRERSDGDSSGDTGDSQDSGNNAH